MTINSMAEGMELLSICFKICHLASELVRFLRFPRKEIPIFDDITETALVQFFLITKRDNFTRNLFFLFLFLFFLKTKDNIKLIFLNTSIYMPLAGLRRKRKSNSEAYASESDALPPNVFPQETWHVSYPHVICYNIRLLIWRPVLDTLVESSQTLKKLVFTASLLDVQLWRIIWRSTLQVFLLIS